MTASSGDKAGLPRNTEPRKFGLNQVYPDQSDGSIKTDLDIIAIHGLDTQSPGTWVAWKDDGDPTSGHVHWLQDQNMLPSVIPNARIFTYDWNANFDDNPATDLLLGHADALLDRLHICRFKDSGNRPPYSSHPALVVCCWSRHFTGRGSHESFFTATQLRVVVAIHMRGDSSSELVKYLGNDAGGRGELDEIVQRFCEMVEDKEFKFPMVCFYETQPTDFTTVIRKLPPEFIKCLGSDNKGILVERHSACLQGPRRIGLDVRHAMLSKYAGPEDDAFKRVSTRLLGILESLPRLQASLDHITGKTQKDWARWDKEVAILKRLHTSPFRERKDRNDARVPGTCNWTVCYFFFKDDFEDQRSIVSALSCILHQLFHQKHELLSDAILKQLEVAGERLTSSFGDLWDALLNAAEDPNAGEIVCLFDAIDECEAKGRSQLYRAFRPYGEIRRGFQPLMIQGLPVIHLSGESDEEAAKISQEIDIFIRSKLTSVPNRTYLWVYLILDLIEKDGDIDKNRIIDATTHLPQNVDEAYDRILSKTARPLAVAEMNLAITLQENHRSYDDFDLKSEARFREILRDTCGLFITIVDSKIYLLHHSAKEFLVLDDTMNSHIQTRLNWKHALRPRTSHRILANICIWHLLFAEFKMHPLSGDVKLAQYVRDHIFLDYSAKHWAAHLRKVQKSMRDDDAMTQSILRISRFGHEDIARLLIDAGADKEAKEVRKLTILQRRHEVMFRQTARANDRKGLKDTIGLTPLQWAARNGQEAAVRLLIDAGANREAKGGYNWIKNLRRTPLHWASRRGHEAITRLLLDAGADKEAKDANGLTPLQVATRKGHRATAQLLVEAGTDKEAKDVKGWTPLLWAAREGHRAIVQLLIDAGADKEAKDADGQTPLHWASRRDHEAIARLLIDAGADKEAKDAKGLKPLHWAAQSVLDLRDASEVKFFHVAAPKGNGAVAKLLA
ncbi:ankyrin repeats (3 copies) domain-containing protein [Hirsutella rhossiliensis]|uniref:Ankyrin repeats (3 copies) domain-containing protein n=1 Tax=Hirsutella rhossiliensis TaxID=111463 RepID=A0A9P8SIY9_9HYPO|nr:ankyrin repeats (3 copies) domain-containing protein [Hirsutella rhossiliensis]KAH0962511.1 ankyrin repeats (3 copies) domain-containing protein [Hirsutella rhossiliensis]